MNEHETSTADQFAEAVAHLLEPMSLDDVLAEDEQHHDTDLADLMAAIQNDTDRSNP